MKRMLALVTLLLVPRVALAQRMEVSRSATLDRNNELSAQTGFQASLGGTTPAGLKLFFDYSHRMTDLVWLNVKLDPTFATGGVRGTCYDAIGRAFDCGGALDANGYALDALAGVKLKFPLRRVALMPYCNFNGGLVGIFSRPQGDGGVAVVARTGGGLRYFVTPHIAVGGELQLTLGPAFYSQRCPNCNDPHNELYRAIDFAVGAEFNL
jgi:hypothetical protein